MCFMPILQKAQNINAMLKNRKSLLSRVGTAAVLTVLLASCGGKENLSPNPNNPPAQILPEQAFTVKVFVEEQGVEKDSLYIYTGEVKSDCPDGKVAFTSVTGVHAGTPARTFTVEPDVVELVLTPWNIIRFETTARVNASSSTDIADIVKDGDLQDYRLKAKIDTDNPRELSTFDVVMPTQRSDKVKAIKEGTTDIRFWNGPEDGGKSITFRVRTANHIAVERFELAIDGKRVFLVEGTKETTYSDLKEDAVLCRLPNIARPREEYYVKGKTDYKTEEVFHTEKFTTIEFIGTIPRNATPDNRLTQIIDALSFRNYSVDTDFQDCYVWNASNYSEFRWMPYRKETQSDFGQPFPPSLGGKRAYKLYPADVRYRKAKIWDHFIKERSERYNENDFYFDYSVAPDPDNVKDVKYYWGKLFLELAKK